MGRMSDLDIVRQEHGLPEDTPLETLVQLAVEGGEWDWDAGWFREAGNGEREFIPYDRLEDKEY